MYISAQASKNMTAIIIAETQGPDRLKKQEPLTVVDQGDSWLVFGNPYTDDEIGLNHCQFYVRFLKDGATIVGLGSEASLRINPAVRHLITTRHGGLTDDQLNDAFGPRQINQLDGTNLQKNLEFIEFLYGGIINSPAGAIEYAYNVIDSSSQIKISRADMLCAEERSGVWNITTRKTKWDNNAKPILTFSRTTGNLITFDG